ncbi:hypothetical protein KP509_14G037500 [Ceratopteris richardii]|nr:hypothetical protein KP509_14G037500 [Ceratopteris richardii]
MDAENIKIFMSVTAASEEVALDKLQAHGGDLNAAINSFYTDNEQMNTVARGRDNGPYHMEVDEPQIVQPGLPLGSSIPHPWVSGQPSRENSDQRMSSNAVILGSDNLHPPSERSDAFFSEEDEVSGPASTVSAVPDGRLPYETIRSSAMYGPQNTNPVGSLSVAAQNEGADIEEEMIRAAIEASRKEASGFPNSDFEQPQNIANRNDDEMAWALSESLQTAEEKNKMCSQSVEPGSSGYAIPQEAHTNNIRPLTRTDYRLLHRSGSSSARENNRFGNKSSSLNGSSRPFSLPHNPVSEDCMEEGEEHEEEPLVRRSARRSFPRSTSVSADGTSSQEARSMGADSGRGIQENGYLKPDSEMQWGGLSSEEQDESVMLEAAMFGTLPEGLAARFRFPVADADLSDNGLPSYTRPVQQPTSPSVIAQRLLREQQDDEYLASLEADREKEARAQREEEMRRVKEAEVKAAEEEKHRLLQEEEVQKRLAAEELERELAAKRAALPEEPPVDDDSAVTLMVRMPDGSRQGRRFRKSEYLQCLFDFIDTSGMVQPGSYRLVRHYPRKALTDGEHSSTFQDLGLSSKHEVLFLEQL